MDPITAGAIQLVLSELIKSGAGELGKRSVGGALDLAEKFLKKIRDKFEGNERALKALEEAEKEGSKTSIDKVSKYLDLEMLEDKNFSSEVQQLANQIVNYEKKIFNQGNYYDLRESENVVIQVQEQNNPIFSQKPYLLPDSNVATASNEEIGKEYARLRYLLEVGEWHQADKETLNLICKLTGRTKEKWLRVEDVNNLTCSDLQIIDNLWAKYSKGRFGFSVQRQICRSCGGSAKNLDIDIWNRFGKLVGWRKQFLWISIWLDTDFLNFSISAPEGHLPTTALNCGYELSIPSPPMKIDGKEYPGIIVEKLKSLDPRLGFSSIINKLEQYGSGNTILHQNFP